MAYVYVIASVINYVKSFKRDNDQSTTLDVDKLPEYEVVIPAKNEELNIRDCLISVLNQTRKPRRIHVINDRSTDRTLEMVLTTIKSIPGAIGCEESSRTLGGFKFKLIKCSGGDVEFWIWSNIDNESMGKGRAINALVKEGFIETPYFLSVDGDTLVEPRFAEMSLYAMTKEPNIAALYGYLFTVPEENTLMGKLYNWGFDISSRISHTIFRAGGNVLGFHYCLSGPRLMFSTSIYRRCPRPTDTKAGDTAHAWELQAEGYDIKCILDTYGVTRMPSKLRVIIKQRINWHSGPFQNLYIRGISTLKRLKSKDRRKFFGGLFAVFYYAVFSPMYHVKWGIIIPILTLLGYFHQSIAIRYYLLDYALSWIFALYSTVVLKRHGYYKKEKSRILLRNFNLFYFFFRLLISWVTLYCSIKTLFEVLYYRALRREHPKWTGYT